MSLTNYEDQQHHKALMSSLAPTPQQKADALWDLYETVYGIAKARLQAKTEIDALLVNLPASSSAEDRKAANEEAAERRAEKWLESQRKDVTK